MTGVRQLAESKLLDAMMAQALHSKKQTEKQQRIIIAAIKIFAEKGFANTSTAEIAKAAEVAEGTIFRHYGTKDNLLLAIILPFLKESVPMMAEEAFKEIMSEEVATFEQFLKALLKNRIKFFTENRKIFQVVIKEIIYKEELKNELLPYFSENIIKRLKIVIALFKERGEFIDIPSERIVNLVLTFLGGFFISRLILMNEDTINEQEIEDAVRFVMEGIRKPSRG